MSYLSRISVQVSIIFTLSIFCGAYFVKMAEAAYPVTELEGYAWSDTIGWISLNCLTGGVNQTDICGTSDYRVQINGSGSITGFAWSSSIGWIRFGGLSNFPTNNPDNPPGNAKAIGTYPDLAFEGWARACAGTLSPVNGCSNMNPRLDGWDGWISLKGANYGIQTIDTGMKADSWAWGSEVIGWIDMDVYADADIAPNLSIDLFGVKPKGAGGGTEIGGEYMDVGFNAIVLGVPAGIAVPYELSIGANKVTGTYKDAVFTPPLILDHVPYNVSTAYLKVDLPAPGVLVESDEMNGNTKTVDIDMEPTKPVLTIKASKKLVRIGQTVTLDYTIIPDTTVTAATCNLQGVGLTGTSVTTSGSKTSGSIKNASNFGIICTGAFGTVQVLDSVEVIPSLEEV